MKFCSSCGNSLSHNSNFCNKCGSKNSNNPSTMDSKSNEFFATSHTSLKIKDYNTPQVHAIIGRNSDRYVWLFNRMEFRESKVSWNWAAFFFGFIWIIYRKIFSGLWIILIVLGVLSFLGPIFIWIDVMIFSDEFIDKLIPSHIASLLVSILFGCFANYIYKLKVDKELAFRNQFNKINKKWDA